MFKNYFKLAFRNLQKNKMHTVINLGGLALGMAIFILISMHTLHELSYDTFHENHRNIYQIHIGGDFHTIAPLATRIEQEISDFETIVRIDDSYGGGESPLLIINNGTSEEKIIFSDVFFADHSLFDIFSFQVIYGDPNTALKEPYSIVLTLGSSLRLFGTANSIGKTIHYIGDRNGQPQMDMTVTAIVEDAPTNSTLQFNALASFSTLYAVRPTGENIDEDWRNWGYKTYVIVKDQ